MNLEANQDSKALGSSFFGEFWHAWRMIMFGSFVQSILYVIVAIYVLDRMRLDILGETAPPGDSLRLAADPLRVLSLLLSGFLALIAIWIGSLMLLIPGLCLAVVFSLLPACTAFSEKRFSFTFAEPFELVSGNIGKTFGVMLTLIFAAFVISMLLVMPTILDMVGKSALSAAADADAALLADYQDLFSPRMLLLQIPFGCLGILFNLVIGFATAVMYLNYKYAPKTAPFGGDPGTQDSGSDGDALGRG